MAETQVHEAAAAPADGGPKAPGGGPAADSLFKNAYFLMLSTGVSAVLGLGFWLVAARYYSEEAVGQGSAAIAAMRLLASITATTMIGAVVRFVPRAGRATASLVWRTYAASSVVVTLAALVFLLTLDLWGASYAPLGTPAAGAVFVAACVAWALLTLQDGVLTGLRKAEWVPAGNAVFSVGKLVLLAVFAGTLPVLGVFVSWAVAIAFSTLPLGWLVFRRLIPRQAAADRHLEPPRLTEMGRFLAGDSLGALFSLAMINLLPVMVAVRFTAAENGYFYVAYTVGGTMEFMAINMASSLTAHASHDPRHLADGVRGALRRMALLLVPVVLVLVVFAPQILTPFDADYAEHGSAVLRLLALGALPRVVVELYIGVLRVQGRTGMLAVVQGTMCTLVLGSAAVLFTPAGIAGAGWAVLLSMTAVAAGCVPGLRSALRGPAGSGGPARGAGDPWERRLRPALWAALGIATVVFWAALRDLPWPGGGTSGFAAGEELTGRHLLDGLPLAALVAGGLLPVVFAASVTLSTRRDPWLPGAALGSAVLALYAAPVALGREPRPAGGALYTGTAGLLADAIGLDGPGPLLRWTPLVLQLLCLVPLWLVLAHAGGRLPWAGRWGVLHLAAVGGWVWQQALAPAAPLLLLLLVLTALLLSPRRPAPSADPPQRTGPNGRSRD